MLIVEDDLIIARDLCNMLHMTGFSACGVARTGAEAMEMIDTRATDIVLADVHLDSGIDGIAVGTHVRATSRAALIYITAFTDDETLERAKVTEPEGYLVKPVKERELQAAVSMALYRTESRRAEADVPLTPRELQVVECMSQGMSGKETAAALHISTKTVEFHRNSIYEKLGCRSAANVVRYAIRKGIVKA